MKLFFQFSDGIKEHQDFPEDEINQSGDDCIENPVSDIIQNNQLLDEKLVEAAAIAINGLEKLPDEIVKKILIQAIKRSDQVCETYNNIIN